MTVSPAIRVVAISSLVASLSSAATSFEYFNDYGTSNLSNSFGLNGGEGWSGGWSAPAGGSATYVGYTADTNITFTNPSYTIGNNLMGSGDGRFTSDDDDSASNVMTRDFTAGLDGTIWISLLVRHSSNVEGDALLWFDTETGGTGTGSYVGLRSGDLGALRLAGDSSLSSDLNTASENVLLLTKIQIDYSGSFDSVDFWVKMESDDLSSEGALGASLLSSDGVDAFGTALDFIGISGGNEAFAGYDSLRVSNDPNAFSIVMTTIPEPSMAGQLMAGVAIVSVFGLARRRRG